VGILLQSCAVAAVVVGGTRGKGGQLRTGHFSTRRAAKGRRATPGSDELAGPAKYDGRTQCAPREAHREPRDVPRVVGDEPRRDSAGPLPLYHRRPHHLVPPPGQSSAVSTLELRPLIGPAPDGSTIASFTPARAKGSPPSFSCSGPPPALAVS
jgi:hypothetical protein